jgi:transketolase
MLPMHPLPETGAALPTDPAQRLSALRRAAQEARLELIRMFSFEKVHHFGGCLSCVDLLTVLYLHKMRFSAQCAADPQRDRFIMSKGHSVPTQYVLLAMLGLIPREELATIKRLGTRLQGHPDILKTPCLEAPTGALGMGLSYANGMALAARLDGLRFNLYVLMGDGELQEGQVWEAAMTSAHYRLGNVCVLVDRNRFQSQGDVDRGMGVEPLEEKWQAFGWDAVRVDGHDVGQICQALDRFDGRGALPLAIVADTVKGKGVSFLENTYKYHNAKLSREQYDQALEEIQQSLAAR